MITINNQQAYEERLNTLKSHFSDIVNDSTFKWENISAILMLRIRKNWTTQSSNSNYQINSDDVKNFFPILQMSDAFPHWRLSMPAYVSKKVMQKFGVSTFTHEWINAHISYRHKLQNGYPYLQLTLEEDLRSLKNILRENDQIFFLKTQDNTTYFIFATKSSLFSEDSVLIYNPVKTSNDKTQFEIDEITGKTDHIESNLNQIFYGAPGTGKSRRIEQIVEEYPAVRTTFHPDTDYSSFVGSYKPAKDKDDPKKITYEFIPQAFMKAYVAAWKDLGTPHFLIIEEINRGNCAQIFGDVFQLLDRRANGFSKYIIDGDTDLTEHLKSELSETAIYLSTIKALNNNKDTDYSKMALPSNLYILASMNTSDQSLFPMDSAFKRRWCWEYIPIDMEDAENLKIKLDDSTYYSWADFLEKINEKILNLDYSEDKQLGNRFMDPDDGIIPFDQFRSKVLFYLWFEIYKDETKSPNTIFRISDEEEITFSKLFSKSLTEDIQKVKSILDLNKIKQL